MKKYRIKPKKSGLCYKIESKVWYFPFWIRVGFFSMLDFYRKDDAEKWLDETLNPKYYKPQKDNFKTL